MNNETHHTSQGQPLINRAVAAVVAVSLATSFINFGMVNQAYADNTENTSTSAQVVAANSAASNGEGSVDSAGSSRAGNTDLAANTNAANAANNAAGNTNTNKNSNTNTAAEGTYTVSWKDSDGETALADPTKVKKGEAPAYKGETPTKKNTATESYAFLGWSKTKGATALTDVVDLSKESITADTTYYAVYKVTELPIKGTLKASLAERFVKTGDNSNLFPATNTDYAAYALYQMGLQGTIDADAIVEAYTNDSLVASDPGRLARWILTITAADMDASVFKVNGETTDLVKKLVAMGSGNLTVDQMVWILPVFDNYSISASNKAYVLSVVESLVKAAQSSKAASRTNQTFAQIVLALAPFESTVSSDGTKTYNSLFTSAEKTDLGDSVDQLIADFVTTIKASQNKDGGFAKAGTGESDLATTCFAVSALCAVSEDVTTYTVGKSTLTPIDYIAGEADGDLDGYKGKTSAADEEATLSALALMALEASDLPNGIDKGNNTNVLNMPYRGTATNNGSSKTNSSASSAAGSSTAKTADPVNGAAAGVVAIAALGALGYSLRRSRN